MFGWGYYVLGFTLWVSLHSLDLHVSLTIELKPGLYFSRRLSAAVAYSYVAIADDWGLLSGCPNALERSASKLINCLPTRNSNSKANSNSNSNFFINLYVHREMAYVLLEWHAYCQHVLYVCVSLYVWVKSICWPIVHSHPFWSFRRCFSMHSPSFCFFFSFYFSFIYLFYYFFGGGVVWFLFQICNFQIHCSVVVITLMSAIPVPLLLCWKAQDPIDKSTYVQVMAWCRQATIHHLNLC